MAKKQLGEWITSKEAADILTANSGHPVSDAYVRLLGGKRKIETMQIDARTRLYKRSDVARIVVSPKRGRKPATKTSPAKDDDPEPETTGEWFAVQRAKFAQQGAVS